MAFRFYTFFFFFHFNKSSNQFVTSKHNAIHLNKVILCTGKKEKETRINQQRGLYVPKAGAQPKNDQQKQSINCWSIVSFFLMRSHSDRSDRLYTECWHGKNAIIDRLQKLIAASAKSNRHCLNVERGKREQKKKRQCVRINEQTKQKSITTPKLLSNYYLQRLIIRACVSDRLSADRWGMRNV